MRYYINILICLVTGVFWNSLAEAGTITSSIGYSFSTNSKLNDPSGFNIKYAYHWDDTSVGIISSFTYLHSDDKKTYEINNVNGSSKKDSTYYSFALGPSLKLNTVLALYGLLGMSNVENQYKIRDIESKKNKVVSFRKEGFIYGTGVLVNVADDFFVSAGMELSKFNDADRKRHGLNVYNFNIGYSW